MCIKAGKQGLFVLCCNKHLPLLSLQFSLPWIDQECTLCLTLTVGSLMKQNLAEEA